MVIDGVNGYIVKPGDEIGLANRIMNLYRNRELRMTLGKNNRSKIEKYFTIEKMVNEHKKLYYDLINENLHDV